MVWPVPAAAIVMGWVVTHDLRTKNVMKKNNVKKAYNNSWMERLQVVMGKKNRPERYREERTWVREGRRVRQKTIPHI